MRGSERFTRLTAVAALALLAGALTLRSASAQAPRGGASSVNLQLMQQYQQAISDRAQLQEQTAKQKKDLDDLKKQVGALKKELAEAKAGTVHTQAELAAAQSTNQTSARSITDLRGKMQELIAHYRELQGNLQTVETDRGQLQQQLATSQSAYDKCAVTNDKLYDVTLEVLDRYQHQGAFSYLARSEPFTRIKRTEVDNMVVEYRERADELKVQKRDAAARPAAGGAGASPPPPGPQH